MRVRVRSSRRGTRLALFRTNRRRRRVGACYMNFILWIVIGGIIGWVASMIMGTNDSQGKVLNVIVGVIGAALGGLLLAPLLGTGTINQGDFSVGSLVTSLLGAVILLAIVGFFRKGRRAV